jgi:hypothetical protein
LAVTGTPLAAGRQHPHAGARPQERPGQVSAGADHVLAVVQHEQQLSIDERVQQQQVRVLPAALIDP